MPLAPFGFPQRMDHLRFCANGKIPQVLFAKRATGNLAHAKAHRRKVFGRWGAMTAAARVVGVTGTQTIWRTLCRTGVRATHIGFLVGFLPDDTNQGVGQALEIDVDDGGGVETYTITVGDRYGSSDGSPNEITWRTVRAPVDADAACEIAVRKLNACRPVSFLCYEIATREAEENLEIGLGEPITDAFRATLLDGYAACWKKNASHLISFLGTKDGASPTVASATWTNVIDGSTSVTANTAGYYLGDGTTTLEQWCRVNSGATLDVVIAAHGSMDTGLGDGEVRLQSASGTIAILDAGDAITSAGGWFAKATTIAAVDAVSKVDLQFRAPAANTLTLDAFDLYAYLS